jgi:hypothetical protein
MLEKNLIPPVTVQVRSRVAGLQVDDLTLQPITLDLIEERITVGEPIQTAIARRPVGRTGSPIAIDGTSSDIITANFNGRVASVAPDSPRHL